MKKPRSELSCNSETLWKTFLKNLNDSYQEEFRQLEAFRLAQADLKKCAQILGFDDQENHTLQ
jgi:hypothetical protein